MLIPGLSHPYNHSTYDECCYQGTLIRSPQEGCSACYVDRGNNQLVMVYANWLYPIGDNVTEHQIQTLKSILTDRVDSTKDIL